MTESPSPASSSPSPSPRREWLFRLVLVAISLVVALGFAEIALRVVGFAAPADETAGDAGEEETFTFFAPHPLLGWDLVPGAVDRYQTDEFDVTLRISEQGLRADRLYDPHPPAGTRRIVALGDSFTFGHGVEIEEAWPSRLAALLSENDAGFDYEAVNLAVTGYGTDQQLLRFEAMGPDFHPDAVVLGLFVGNVFRNARDTQLGYPKPRFVLRSGPGGELELTNVPVSPERVDDPALRLAHLYRAGRGLAEHLGAGSAWPVTGAILDRLAKRCRELDAPLFVLLLPRDQSVYGEGLRRRLHRSTLDRTLDLTDARDLPRLDLAEALNEAARAGAPPLYFAADGHWTPEGHRVAAEAAASWLRTAWPANSEANSEPAEPPPGDES